MLPLTYQYISHTDLNDFPPFDCPLQGRPFFFTFFVSNEVKLHPTSSDRADDFLRRHVGDLVDPPGTVERLDAIGPFVGQDVEVGG
jgi:hypothetical protein